MKQSIDRLSGAIYGSIVFPLKHVFDNIEVSLKAIHFFLDELDKYFNRHYRQSFGETISFFEKILRVLWILSYITASLIFFTLYMMVAELVSLLIIAVSLPLTLWMGFDIGFEKGFSNFWENILEVDSVFFLEGTLSTIKVFFLRLFPFKVAESRMMGFMNGIQDWNNLELFYEENVYVYSDTNSSGEDLYDKLSGEVCEKKWPLLSKSEKKQFELLVKGKQNGSNEDNKKIFEFYQTYSACITYKGNIPEDIIIYSELVADTELHKVRLFVKEYLVDEKKQEWAVIPKSMYFVDEDVLKGLLRHCSNHPLNRDPFRTPSEYSGQKTRYRHYPCDGKKLNKALQKALNEIVKNIVDIAEESSIAEKPNPVKNIFSLFKYTPPDTRSHAVHGLSSSP